MALLNYSTKIEPEQSIAEIQRMLVKHGVHAMRTDYDGPQVEAVSFQLSINGREVSFKLPCNWRAVYEVLKQNDEGRGYRTSRRTGNRYKEKPVGSSEEQAVRVAWRVIKDWVEAQLALVEINMVSVPQVFLPYALTPNGRTLGEAILDDPSRLLGSG